MSKGGAQEVDYMQGVSISRWGWVCPGPGWICLVDVILNPPSRHMDSMRYG